MADKKKSAGSGEDGHTLAFEVIFIIILVMTIGGAIGGREIYKKLNPQAGNTTTLENTEGDLSFLGRIFPTGVLDVGKKIMNKGEIVVRGEPGGIALGKQKAREFGKILAGPIKKFGSNWWRIDYKNAPDGWVLEDVITSKTLLFGALNIIPITLGILKPFLIFLSIVFVVLILFVVLKNRDLKKVIQKQKDFASEQERMKHHGDETVPPADEQIDDIEIENLPTGGDAPKTENVNNRRWANIQTLINSHSVNDWRQAIIEADIILYEMLDKMGYKGESIGDKLKQVERSDFLTIDKAWEAHKVRNRIAHKSSYVLSRDEAEKAIDLYKEVFSEFYFV